MITHRISGPPGTGKTTRLMGIVEGLLKDGVDPEDIVFTSFTRAAATEARDRACERFNLPKNRFPYFKTLHALCYELGNGKKLMTGRDWAQIASATGLRFTLSKDESSYFNTRGDVVLSLHNLVRNCGISEQEVISTRPATAPFGDITVEELQHFRATLDFYKRETGLSDFTDLLEYVCSQEPPVFRYVISDEAQDLSPLLGRTLRHITRYTEKLYVAGDDDQCIHAWNGASIDYLLGLQPDHDEVLPQSFRIPASVHRIADRIVQRIQRRLPKTYLPRAAPGHVTEFGNLSDIKDNGEPWLLLVRNRSFIPFYTKHCIENALPFTTPESSEGLKMAFDGIRAWTKLTTGKQIQAYEAQLLYGLMSLRDRVARGFKGSIKDLQTPIDFEGLRANYGLVANPELHWIKALDMVPEDTKSYCSAVVKKYGVEAKPLFEINTIHGVKGREAHNVAIMTDFTNRTEIGFQSNPDDEHRVFYVGVTRARENLVILSPCTNKHYPM